MADRADDGWAAWAAHGQIVWESTQGGPGPAPHPALDPAALHEMLVVQARQNAQLRAELAKLGEQISELTSTLAAMQVALTTLDRDALRSERRDRELLDVVQALRDEFETLRAVGELERGAPRPRWSSGMQAYRERRWRWPWRRQRGC